jgi:hypothetical protein
MAAIVRIHAAAEDWAGMKPMLERVFQLAPRTLPARAGRCFERKVDVLDTEGSKAPPTALDASCREE